MIAVALFASAGTGMAAVVDFSAWTNSTRINFNTTSTGANISSDQTNFPVLVHLDANNFIFTQADPTGKDIRFADPDRNSLSYEIDRWDAALKKAEIWVLVPQIDANSDRDYIDMYWGNGAATALSSGSAVFTSGTSWVGVWHLDEDGNTTAAGYGDATANAYTGTGTGLSGSSDVSGQMGLGQQFDGATTYITLTGTYPITTAARTMSLWAKAASPITGNQVIAAYGSYPGAGNQVFGLSEWSTPKWGSWTDGASNPSGTTPPDQGWHHLVASYDGATVRFYQDGALAGSGALTLNTTSGNFVVGARMNDKTLKWTGVVDELRMSSVQRSADWIKLEYENQKTGSRFLAYPNTLLSTFSYSSKVYINTTASGANITSNQSDFPLLVRLTNGNFNFAQAKSDGGDLRFADSSGALLPYEIERFDATNRLAEIWVSIPTVYAGNNTQWFRMYWGKATATSLSSSAAVFQTADNFAGEWHLSEASGSASDASSNGNNGAFNGNVPNQQNGIIGKAHLFDGNGDYINAGTNGSYDLSANDRVTVSAWVNRSGAAASGPEEGIATKYHWTDNNRSFGIWYTSATAFKFGVSTNGTAETIVSSGSAATNGAWYHVVGVADGAKARIYVNGVEAANTAFSGNINYSSGSTFRIGEVDDGGGGSQQYFNGYIDEVSVSNVVRSADWIKLSYETQKAAATAVSIGARTADFTNSVRFNFNTTATGANVSGSDVTNIPILVRLSSSNFDFSKTTDAGTDIKFIDKDGTNLYHEVVEWDKANQSGKVWVKVPQVDKNSTSDFITLYYGCAACTGNPYAVDDSVWNGFKGVFHLNAPEDKAYDATALANHGTYFKDQANITGLTGKNAPFFDGSTDYIDVPNETNYDIFTNISAWAWIKVSSLTKGWQTILSKGDNSWR
ncbi:MAG: hypothetical protein JWO30_1124, partial [Fibrobacteres bacterium]|nr:hypothetical protein [Fibrobacterota bacterium]